MTQYAMSIYDTEGRITLTGDVSESTYRLYREQGHLMVDRRADPTTQYVVDGELRSRPANPTLRDGMTLQNMPAPCTMTVNGKPYTVTEPTVTLTFPRPGPYTVVVTRFPFLDATFEFTV